MRWRRVVSECLGVTLALALFHVPQSATALAQTNKPAFDPTDCEAVLPCHKCSVEETQDVRECAVHHKIVTLSCTIAVDSNGGTLGGYYYCNCHCYC